MYLFDTLFDWGALRAALKLLFIGVGSGDLMGFRAKKLAISLVSITTIMVGFQNCSSPYDSVKAALENASESNPLPEMPLPAELPVVSPAPVPSGPVYYFSDCQAGAQAGCVAGNNANDGTSVATAKRNLAGFDYNTLPAGAQLLFNRGGAWASGTIRLFNPNATTANPLMLAAYGNGPLPILRFAGNIPGIETGEFEQGPTFTAHGGYIIRELRVESIGTGATNFGIWLRGGVHYVYIEGVEITGFYIGLNAQGGQDVNHVTIINSRIFRNNGMGTLGSFRDTIFQNNIYDGNNYISGSAFNHAIYLSGGTNLVIRQNDFVRNSVVNGICLGGNLTAHGVINNLLIENNRFVQDAGDVSCFGISLTAGYNTPEGFRNVVIRENTLTNIGGFAIAINTAPGVLVEANRIKRTTEGFHYGISVARTEEANDLPGGGERLVNNEFCLRPGQTAVSITTNGTQSGTIEHTTCPF